MLGIKRMPVTLLNVAVGVAAAEWAWGIWGPVWAALLGWGALYLAPLWWVPLVPATIRMRVGEPIEPDELFSSGDEELDGAYAKVEGRVQELVTALARGE